MIHLKEASLDILKQFDYGPNKWVSVVCFFMASAGAVMFTCFAFLADKPMNLLVTELTAAQVRMIYGTLALLSPIAVIGLGATVYTAFFFKRRVALAADHLILPRPTRLGLATDEIKIPFKDISQVSVKRFSVAPGLFHIQYLDRWVSFESTMFRTRTEFDELCSAIQTEFEKRSGVMRARERKNSRFSPQ